MTAPIPRDIPDLPAVPGPPALLPSPVPATAVVTPVRRPLVAVFRLLTATLAAAGVTIELSLAGPATPALSHFTVQSGILLAVVLALSARRAWTAARPLSPALTGAALLYTVASALVHHTLLANPASPYALPDAPTGWHAVAAHLLYTALPLAATADWLLLTVPGRLRLRHAAGWMLYPLAYLAFSLGRGELLIPDSTARYLYPFLDVDQHGYKGVLGNALLLGLSLYALATLLVALDHTRPNPLRRPC
ncbi:Pr6Pr family membrane protein [Streptomyces sp. ISL-12]|uniref:Pr6Pr family membrane protein n=1 Tax=Streptomyces sp. ISL-12 TaxID=2819177 RepID=UPI001BEC3D69|nr:Pr6Pr family membrane protein [Streptomyces sp. ISL-12]MBT2411590.1 Pr6Pr family membrane protein [Streptomyces sp. ISL-12]